MSVGFQMDQSLDCRELCCPLPILRTRKALDRMTVGQVLKMVATDPAAKPDMIAFSKQTGHELLASKEEDGLLIFYIRKTK